MKYTKEKAVQKLSEEGFKVGRNVVNITGKFPGIKIWGVLDYLKNHHSFSIVKQIGNFVKFY